MKVKKFNEKDYRYFTETVSVNFGEKRTYRFYYFPSNNVVLMNCFFSDGQLQSTFVLQVILEEDETENDVTFTRLLRQAAFELDFIID